MRDMPSQRFQLPPRGENALADAIRDAFGAAPEDAVEVTTPQFTRTRGMQMPGQPPSSLEEWSDYRALPMSDLVALGFGNWDGSLALIPGEWFRALPKGLELWCISGERVVVGDDELDDDIRFGCLAYGILPQNGTDYRPID